jgi:DNA polymerase-3 subunit beta
MKIPRETLNAALALVSKATSANSSLPILTCVDLQAEPESLTLTATNLELTIRTRIGAQVDSPFSAAVPTGILTSIIAASEAETVDLVYDEPTTTLKVKSLGAKSKIKALDHDEFPPVPGTETPLGMLPAHLLKAALKRVVIAASTDMSRPVLNGVQLAKVESEVTLAAADGFRLAVSRLELPLTFPEGHSSLVLPRQSVLKLVQILPDDDQMVSISVSKNAASLQFTWQAASVWMQLLDFQFPDWQQIIPPAFKHTLSLPGKDTLSAIQRAEVFAREANHVVRFKPGSESDLLIEGNSDETGKSETALPVAMPFQIAFNSIFAKQGIEAIGSDAVHLHLNAENTPALLTNGSDRFRYLIMPMLENSLAAAKAAEAAQTAEQ